MYIHALNAIILYSFIFNLVLNVKFSESLYVGEEDSVIEIVVEATNDFMDPFTVLVMPYSYQSGDPYKENEAKEGIHFL